MLTNLQTEPICPDNVASLPDLECPERPNVTRAARIAAALVFVGTLAVLLAWRFRQEPPIRRFGLRAMTAAYSIYDPAGNAPHALTGPTPDGNTIWSTTDQQLADQLAKWFPDRSFVVRSSGQWQPQPVAFRHEPYDSPASRAFRNGSRDIWETATDLFDLSDNLRELTTHGEVRNDAPVDAPAAYLREARCGRPLSCRYFAITFVALCSQRGYSARMLGLSRNGTRWDHAVTEVYAPEFGKWILIDPDFNVGYRRHGIWQNAHELHQAWKRFQAAVGNNIAAWAKGKSLQQRRRETANLAEVEIVPFSPAGDSLRSTNLAITPTGMNLGLYNYVVYAARNDYLTNHYPPAHPAASAQFLLRDDADQIPAVCPEASLAAVEDVYWPVGRSRALLTNRIQAPIPTIECTFQTYTPNFTAFEISLDEGQWRRTPSNHYIWKLTTDSNRLAVRSVNAAGLRGEPTIISIKASSTAANGPAPLFGICSAANPRHFWATKQQPISVLFD